jgi:uncharacterized membrane protein
MIGLVSFFVFRSNWRGIQIFTLVIAVVMLVCAEVMGHGRSMGANIIAVFLEAAASIIILGILIGWLAKFIVRCLKKKREK